MAGETKVLTTGQDASALDIFLSANGASVSGKYVGFELFDAAGASAVSGVALNPDFGRYVGSGTIPASNSLGTWRVDWTIVTQANSVALASEAFCVQDINITIGFQDAQDKTSQIYDAVRLDVGDPEGNIFNDQFLERILSKAVRRLNHRLGLSSTSRPKGIPGNFGGRRLKVSPIVANLTSGTITPDNDEICDLVIMQMELIVLESELSALKRLNASSGGVLSSDAGKDGISVRNADGVQMSFSGGRLSFRADLYKFDVKNRREELEGMIKAFLNRMSGNFSKLIY